MLSMNISKLSADWNISAIVSSNAKARGGKEEEMQKEFEEAMMNRVAKRLFSSGILIFH